MSKAIGVIAEDVSDVEVVIALFEKYVPRNTFYVRRFVGNGCGKLRSKCRTWAENLLRGGCEHIFLFHDRDRHKEEALRKSLLAKLPPRDFPQSVIVIPVEEMEAWLLSDEEAIKAVFALKETPKRYINCEDVNSPKEELERLVWVSGKKRYLNTVHNKRIAEKTTLENLRRCPSFVPFDEFVRTQLFAG